MRRRCGFTSSWVVNRWGSCTPLCSTFLLHFFPSSSFSSSLSLSSLCICKIYFWHTFSNPEEEEVGPMAGFSRRLIANPVVARPSARQNNGIESPNLIMWLGVFHPICICQGHAHVAVTWIWCFRCVIYLFPQALAKQQKKQKKICMRSSWLELKIDLTLELKSRPFYAPWWTSLLYAYKEARFAALEDWNVKVAGGSKCSSQQETGNRFPRGGSQSWEQLIFSISLLPSGLYTSSNSHPLPLTRQAPPVPPLGRCSLFKW